MSLLLDNDGTESTYSFRLVISTGLSDENISCIGTHLENLYIGTSHGRILHYYKFGLEYVLISQLATTGATSPGYSQVDKFLVLPSIDRILVLVGGVVSVYTVPELSPCRVGKLKGIQDISILTPLKYEGAKQLKNDKVVAFTNNAVRIVQVTHTGMKLLKDINYARGVCGMSTFTSSPNSNYSNLVLCANDTNYDIVDLKLNRKIPLFEHNLGNASVAPIILPYDAEDTGSAEYLLTIGSDQTTSLAMFVNSVGDVTRGTLTWIGEGYPTGGLVSIWPYVLGIFKTEGKADRLTVSSLTSLQVLLSKNVERLIGGEEDITKEEKSEKVDQTLEDPDMREVTAEGEADLKEGADITLEPTAKGSVEALELGGKEESLETSGKITLGTSVKITDATLETGGKITLEGTDITLETDAKGGEIILGSGLENLAQLDISSRADSSSTELIPENSAGVILPESTSSELTTDVLLQPNQYSITEVLDISFDDTSLQDCLTLVNSSSLLEIPTEIKLITTSNVLIYNTSEVWLLYKADKFAEILSAFDMQNLSIITAKLTSSVDHFNGEIHQYLLFLLVICYFSLEKHDEAMKYLLRIKDGNLLISPLFVIKTSLGEWNHTDLFIFKGISEVLTKLNVKPNHGFLRKYLQSVYGEIIKQRDPTYYIIREVYYKHLLLDSQSTLKFLETDESNWSNTDHANPDIIEILDQRQLSMPLLVIYKNILKLTNDATISEKFCHLALQELTKIGSVPNSQLIQDLLSHLNSLDEVLYSKYLLEILSLDQELGLQYIKHNKKYMEVNRKIMLELSGNYNSLSFTLLKIEYLEHFLAESLLARDRDELLQELIMLLTRSDNFSEEELVNFTILQSTYTVENSLFEPNWPKVAWVDFLKLSLHRLESKEFTIAYLKVFELLIMHENKDTRDDFLDLLEGDIFEYLRLFRGETSENIEFLLSLHDYSMAEYYAVHRMFPKPKNPYYLHSKEAVTVETAKENLLKVFNHYIECKDEVERINSVRHFISTYSGKHFTSLEIITLLPSSTPIVYLVEYLTATLVDLNADSQGAVLHKSISKTNASFTKSVYYSLTK